MSIANHSLISALQGFQLIAPFPNRTISLMGVAMHAFAGSGICLGARLVGDVVEGFRHVRLPGIGGRWAN